MSRTSADFQVYCNKMCQIACGNFSVWDKLLFLQVEKETMQEKRVPNVYVFECMCADFWYKNLNAQKAKRSIFQPLVHYMLGHQ